MNGKYQSFFKELGARIAQTRKERGIAQVQSSAPLGIAQQTLAHYEGRRLRLPAARLEQQIAQITQLPRAKRRFVTAMLDTVLAQASR